ncbi:MAG TPA: tetratricopeptide repeat protein [Candidatus Eisenbacteria bacterium]|nr:tetratricopeptide repeat protein [Candidatus Eisenbacteria bacterium]
MQRWRSLSVLVLAVTAVILYAIPTATILYAGVVLLHTGLGVLAVLALLFLIFQGFLRQQPWLARIGWLLLLAGGGIGFVLIKIGTEHRYYNWLYTHIALCSIGFLFLATSWLGSRGWLNAGIVQQSLRFVAVAAVLGCIAAGAWWARNVAWQSYYVIRNPEIAPATMNNEGDGPNGKFFPSSAQTKDGKYIPSDYFLQAKACERCHADIYKQWESSMHHFSSFNNQWYRQAIVYMQEVDGVKPSKWCAGCHDPALLFSGKFDTPIKDRVHTPEANAGLSCMMCHSIVHVKSTMGQSDYVLEYPKLHALAASQNPLIRRLHDFMVRLNPEPHRRVFLKPFMRDQVPEFCSGCHKVHLDVPLNNYRWLRGFDEYDNWQASGVSGQGARSFYYPKTPMMCADCHMPLVPSHDEGNINGYVHSHRFPGANTAVPTANEDPVQLETSRKFLQDGQVSVDIFAVSPVSKTEKTAAPSAGYPKQELSTSFAVGEEAETNLPEGPAGEARPITAPLGRVDAAVRRGDDVLVDVVVRTRKVGHFFPGGTVDAFDCWLELQATDDKGQTLFWSGKVADDGKGPVDPGAHFYKSLQIDDHGNVINKRNAWATHAVVYVHLIPPGAADTVHFRMHVPEGAGDHITFHSKLNYRKFMWWNTQFAYAGVEGQPSNAVYGDPGVTKSHDDRKWSFEGATADVSGKLKSIPNLPIIVMAEDTETIRVLPHSAPEPAPQVTLVKDDWTRWNDYGIGLFLQGDLKGAEQAFTKITEMAPDNFDGWTNVGRVRLQEGNTDGAKAVLLKALALKPDLARANYFYARVLKDEGKYDEAERVLQLVLEQYPRDRVVHNEFGRILFLQKRYADAVKQFDETLSIDPEDLQANYNLMLCYTGLGDDAQANEHKVRYLRFKADESSQSITGAYRQAHPDDNLERQAIHEHVSIPLPILQASRHSKRSTYEARKASAVKPVGGGR